MIVYGQGNWLRKYKTRKSSWFPKSLKATLYSHFLKQFNQMMVAKKQKQIPKLIWTNFATVRFQIKFKMFRRNPKFQPPHILEENDAGDAVWKGLCVLTDVFFHLHRWLDESLSSNSTSENWWKNFISYEKSIASHHIMLMFEAFWNETCDWLNYMHECI